MKKPTITQARLFEEQIRTSISNYFNTSLALFFTSLFWYLALLNYSLINHAYLDLWFGLQLLVSFFYGFLYVRYHKKYHKIKSFWRWKIEFPLTCFSGFIWGMGWFFFIEPSNLTSSFFLNAIICGITIGYSTGTPLDKETTYGGLVFSLIPVIIKCFLIGSSLFFWFGILTTLYLIAACLFSQSIHNFYIDMLMQREANAQLVKALETEKQQVEKVSQEKTRFLAAASHDLRQPIQAINLFEKILSSKLNTSQQQEILAKISESNKSLSNLLDSLLDISKLDSGIVEINPQVIYIDDIFHSIYQQYSLLAKEKQIELRCAATRLKAFIDPHQLERILNNLVINAIKYMGRPGKILLGVRRKKEFFIIEVWDNGEGIPEEEQKNIFEEFYQINNIERNRAKGLGLGLAIVSRLANLMKSELKFQSTYGKGCYFSLSFPIFKSPRHDNEKLNHTNLAQKVLENDYFLEANQYLILILEDDPLLIDAANKNLT